MARGELLVDTLVRLAVRVLLGVEGEEAAVVLRQLLLDDVRLQRDAEVVGLAREVGREVVVGLLGLEGRVAQVAPQDGRETRLVRALERLAHLLDLARGLRRPEVDGGPRRHRPHVHRLLHAGEHYLVELVGVGEELVVVDLHDEGDLGRVAPRHRAEHPQRGRHRVAPALDREPHDRLGVEDRRVLGEGRAGRVLDALVHGQDRDVSGARQAAVGQDLLEVAQDRDRAVRDAVDAVHEVGPGQVQRVARDAFAAVLEERAGVGPQQVLDGLDAARDGAGVDGLGGAHVVLRNQFTRAACIRSSAALAASWGASVHRGLRVR